MKMLEDVGCDAVQRGKRMKGRNQKRCYGDYCYKEYEGREPSPRWRALPQLLLEPDELDSPPPTKLSTSDFARHVAFWLSGCLIHLGSGTPY